MDSMVIILNGSGGSGKDTFVNFVEEFINTYHYSSITKIKEVAQMLGWKGEKSEEARKFLCELKLLSSKYNDFLFEEIDKAVKRFKQCNEHDSLLFIDIREPDEIKKAVETFNAMSVLIVNENVEHIKNNTADGNVFNYKYDYIVKNDGDLNSLREQAKRFVKKYKKGELLQNSQNYCPYYNSDEKISFGRCFNCENGYEDDGVLYCQIG